MSLLLHLSDLHLGLVNEHDIPDDYKTDILPLEQRLSRQRILKETLTQLAGQLKADEKLDAVIISGDVTVRCDERGFEMLEEVLTWLGPARPAPDHIVVVPGNHDVRWGVADSTEKYELFLKHVRSKGYITPLLEGIDFADGEISVSDLSRHYLLDSEKAWAIVPINSSHYCGSVEPIHSVPNDVWQTLPSEIALKHTGLTETSITDEFRRLRQRDIARISNPDQLNAMREVASTIRGLAGGSQSPVLIGVIHHHLLPVSVREELKPFESITNLGHLRIVLRDNRYSALLHGHKHTSNVYFDHITALRDGESASDHRVLVVSAPAVKTPGIEREVLGRLIGISGDPNAPRFALRDVASVESGTKAQLPEPRFYPLWQLPSNPEFARSGVNLVTGDSVDEVYGRTLALFDGKPASSLLPNVICQIAAVSNPVTLPKAYPQIPDVSPEERATWFRRIVDWWQRSEFKRLSAEQHFNHGYRIRRYSPHIDQFERVAEAILHSRKTSRGIITLLRPTTDQLDDASSRFPSFCFMQFVLRSQGKDYALDVIGYFRKQEIRFWWPVNVAELCELQLKIFNRIKSGVEREEKARLSLGVITTIAATAEIGDEIPNILMPAVDFELEESPQRLWDMTYAVYLTDMRDREGHVMSWTSVLNDLIPPINHDRTGASVSIQGVRHLAELAEHFARHHNGVIAEIAGKWRELERINVDHARAIVEGRVLDETHQKWRNEVITKLNEIRELVNSVFVGDIPELP